MQNYDENISMHGYEIFELFIYCLFQISNKTNKYIEICIDQIVVVVQLPLEGYPGSTTRR